ncbi:MAG TPA: TrkA C-terminal domain-containing protein, partial [Burkholderiales bacterium]
GAVRRAHHNQPALPDMVIAEDDVVLLIGSNKETVAQAARSLGEAAPGRIAGDRSDMDYLRVFVSKPTVVGMTLAQLQLPGPASVVQLRRGDAEILPGPDLVLEFGDRVGVLTGRGQFGAIRKYFGDSIKGTAEFSFISIGIGMALGFLLGAIQFPVPAVGKVAIGLSGVLVMALLLGYLRRTGPLNWTIPISANLVMRNLGLTLFLAQVGMASGPKFAATVADTGLLMLGLGALVLLALVLPIMLIGLFAFRMPYDELVGIVAGACGNPAILAYGNKLTPTERPDIGYAMIFPGMTIIKILFVDIVPALLR